jgi:acetolactate synthase-1/2/3 large subunit
MDVFSARLDAPIETVEHRLPTHERAAASTEGVAKAVDLLLGARAPMIFAGNGVNLSGAWEELRSLAELTGTPVATTLTGKGVFPESHPLSLGTTGIWGTRAANETAREADVIVAVGTGFAEADCSSWKPGVTFSIPPARVVQIDTDPEEVGKIYPIEVGLVGDARLTLAAMIDRVGGRTRPPSDSRVADRKARWRAEVERSQRDEGTPIHPARLLHAIANTAPRDAIFVTDVGWNKNGAGQQLRVDAPRSFITSGGMATMGFAPAAAIGAKIAAPSRKVICLVGDGGLLSVIGALTTAVELNIPVTWVLFNNFCFSTIRTVGTTYFNSTYGTEFTRPDGTPYNPDFPLLARAFGLQAARVTKPGDLERALTAAFDVDAPYLLEVETRGDVPMPRTGFWDIAEFLEGGND